MNLARSGTVVETRQNHLLCGPQVGVSVTVVPGFVAVVDGRDLFQGGLRSATALGSNSIVDSAAVAPTTKRRATPSLTFAWVHACRTLLVISTMSVNPRVETVGFIHRLLARKGMGSGKASYWLCRDAARR